MSVGKVFDRMPYSSDRAQLGLFRKALWEEHYGLCGICGHPVDFMVFWVDHIIPSSLDGGDEWANLQPSHRPCNIAKGGKNRSGVSLPNAPRVLPSVRPIVDDATLQAWIGDPPTKIGRGVDPDLWHRVRVEALRRKLTVGELLNGILRLWLAQHRDTADFEPRC